MFNKCHQWIKNCLPFRSSWVQPRIFVGFALPTFSFLCFDHCFSFGHFSLDLCIVLCFDFCLLIWYFQTFLYIYLPIAAHGEVCSIKHYVVKFVSNLRQLGGFLREFWCPPPIKPYVEFIFIFTSENINSLLVRPTWIHHLPAGIKCWISINNTLRNAI